MWIGLWKKRWIDRRGRTVAAASLLGLLIAMPATASEPQKAPFSLALAQAVAVNRNPDVGVARIRVEEARERLSRARVLPEPSVGVFVAVQEVETRVGPQKGRISLEQTLPARGKRDARSDRARAEVERAEAELAVAAARVRREAAVAFLDLYRVRRAFEITRESRDLLVYLEGVVRKAYESGGASYAELMRIQLELGRLENEVRTLERALDPALVAMQAVLSQDPDGPLSAPVLPDATPRLLSKDLLTARMLEDSPELVLAAAVVRERSRDVTISYLEQRRDWSVGLDWIPTGDAVNPGVRGSGDDAVWVGVRTRWPFDRSRYRAIRNEANLRQGVAEQRREAVVDSLHRQLAKLVFDFETADREVRLYRDTLLPKARQSLEASEVGFRAGTVSVSDLVEAQRLSLEFELALEEARARRMEAIAGLETVVGEDVVEWDAASTSGGA